MRLDDIYEKCFVSFSGQKRFGIFFIINVVVVVVYYYAISKEEKFSA